MDPHLTHIVAAVNRLLPEPQAGLLVGMIFGVKATMSPALVSALTATGTLHVVALSGTNITILTKLVGTTLLAFVSRRISSLLTVCIIIGFVWFVGPSPSVVRAAIMGGVSLVAIASGRQVWGFWAWCIAIFSMLALQMDLITNLSFQLSAGASLGLILFGDEPNHGHHPAQVKSVHPLLFPVHSLLSFLALDLRTTLAAQTFTIPIIFFAFHRVSLISPLTNMLIGWVLTPITAGGLVTAILAVTLPPLGQLAAWALWVPLTFVIGVVDLTARLPFASVGF
jgi:competence protein ComEC